MLLKQTWEFLLLNKSATSLDSRTNFFLWRYFLLNIVSDLKIFLKKSSTFLSIVSEFTIHQDLISFMDYLKLNIKTD